MTAKQGLNKPFVFAACLGLEENRSVKQLADKAVRCVQLEYTSLFYRTMGECVSARFLIKTHSHL